MDIRKFLEKKSRKRMLDSEITDVSNQISEIEPLPTEIDKNTEQCSSATHSETSTSANPIRALNISKVKPIQPYLSSYPKTKYNAQNRVFSASWYRSYKWLEYIEEHDVALCFACRIYAPYVSKERAWTHDGFNNWNIAKPTKKGLQGHSNSNSHKAVVKAWDEHNPVKINPV